MTEYEMTPAQQALQEAVLESKTALKEWREEDTRRVEALKKAYEFLIQEKAEELQETDLLSLTVDLGLLVLEVSRRRSTDQGEAAACVAAEPERSGAFLTFQWKLISAAAYKAAMKNPILGQWAFRVVDHSAPKASFSQK